MRVALWSGPLLLATALAFGCSRSTASPSTGESPVAVIKEAFLTPAVADGNIDSVAVWRRGTPAILLATAKTGNTLHVFDAATGVPLGVIGESGTGAGQLRRPNGIAVLEGIAFVVERDNHRLQAFALPRGESLLVFGAEHLRRPYGITAYAEGESYVLMVTDNYEQPDGAYPPDNELGRRVHRFRVTKTAGTLSATHEAAFGETTGDGRLRKVETIMADPSYRRVLVAEEDPAIRSLRIYTPDGQFTGQSVGGWFATEPEGVALVPCGRQGYWIATDQHDTTVRNVFHVFDRRTLEHRGAFRGATTHTTDGVAMTSGTLGRLEGGAFYALHNDAQVAAFAWSEVEKALSLERCQGGDTQD